MVECEDLSGVKTSAFLLWTERPSFLSTLPPHVEAAAEQAPKKAQRVVQDDRSCKADRRNGENKAHALQEANREVVCGFSRDLLPEWAHVSFQIVTGGSRSYIL